MTRNHSSLRLLTNGWITTTLCAIGSEANWAVLRSTTKPSGCSGWKTFTFALPRREMVGKPPSCWSKLPRKWAIALNGELAVNPAWIRSRLSLGRSRLSDQYGTESLGMGQSGRSPAMCRVTGLVTSRHSAFARQSWHRDGNRAVRRPSGPERVSAERESSMTALNRAVHPA